MTIPAQGISLLSIGRGILGIMALLLIAYLLCTDRKNIPWRTVATGLALQLILAFGILYVPFIQNSFEWAGRAFVKIMDFTRAGSAFLFGSLLGTKMVLNELVAYADFNTLKNAGALIQEKSIIITTFALCGFANISSIGMQIGGIGVLAPGQRKMLTRYGPLAMISGMLASCMSATLIGMIVG